MSENLNSSQIPDNSREPLAGTYRVSFDLYISPQEDLDSTDVIHSIASGFDQTSVLSSLANIQLEKMQVTSAFKPGDRVVFSQATPVRTTISSKNGYYFAGIDDAAAHYIGETVLEVPSTVIATVNKVLDCGRVEITDIDIPIQASLLDTDTDEPVDINVSVIAASVSPDFLKKVS